MRLNRSRELNWGDNATTYSVCQRYRGHTAAAFALISNDATRAMIASDIMRMRRKVRTIIARTDRKIRKANAR